MRRPHLALLAGVLVGACAPCHRGQSVTTYHAAYDSLESYCAFYDEDGLCGLSIPYIKHHPATCTVSWHCLQTCDEVARGKLEREHHAKHEPIPEAPAIDAGCPIIR